MTTAKRIVRLHKQAAVFLIVVATVLLASAISLNMNVKTYTNGLQLQQIQLDRLQIYLKDQSHQIAPQTSYKSRETPIRAEREERKALEFAAMEFDREVQLNFAAGKTNCFPHCREVHQPSRHW
jgi:hypothetical protein